MKKLLSMLVLMLAVVCIFTACNLLPGTPTDKKDVITVEDGYLVVNGVKTDYQVKTNDVIEVVDGYVVVNGVKTEHKVDTPDVIEIIDGYVVVNGVKTDIFVPTCNHSWTTVTTPPTCTAGGYDTKTCSLCGKSVVDNETAKLDHNYATTYSFDDNNHWFGCTGCDAKKDIAAHTPDADNNCTVCGTPLAATPGIIYDISADGTYAEVIGYEGTATKVKIASEYKGLPVKAIAENAFSNYKGITDLIIPEGVTSIGRNGLIGCRNCTITIPSTLTNIGDWAFMGCDNLSINVNNISSWCQQSLYIERSYNLYLRGVLVTDLVIPENVTEICDYAFNNCNSLKSVVMHDNVTSVGISAFANCINLESVEFSRNLKVVQMESFRGTNVSSIIIPNGVEEICDNAFYGCGSLTTVDIPDSVRKIGQGVFSQCSVKYNEYDNCLYLGNSNNPYHALIGPSGYSYSRYEVHPDAKIIADYAFNSCSRLGSIVLNNKITDIGYYALLAPLTDIYYTGTLEEWNAINKGYIDMSVVIHYNYDPTP